MRIGPLFDDRALLGRRALVTGASQGIGAGIVEALRKAGARVIGLDRLGPFGDEHIACDLGDAKEISGSVDIAAARLGGIDILVNNAGINERRALAEIDAGYLDHLMHINLRAPILVAAAAISHMAPGGRIINIASELALLGRAEGSVYAATKGGMLALTRSWARELAPHILVNAVAPGPTDTPMLGFDSMTEERRREELGIPLGRIAAVGEVAATVVFLCSAGGAFYTGQCLSPNGGAAMY